MSERIIVQGDAIYLDPDKGDPHRYYREHIAAGDIAVELTPEDEYKTDKATIAALHARVAELEAALKPFAKMAQHYDGKHGNRVQADNNPVFEVSTGGMEDAGYTVGDLRAARAALGGG